MTGERLTVLRKALGFDLAWFASLLGMSAAKLEQWEREDALSLHPLQAQTLALLEMQVRILGVRAPALGKQILSGTILYGPPYGLYVLLQTHFAGYAPEFTPAALPGRNNLDP